MTGQRRGTALAMPEDERDTFLRSQPVCRVATVGEKVMSWDFSKISR